MFDRRYFSTGASGETRSTEGEIGKAAYDCRPDAVIGQSKRNGRRLMFYSQLCYAEPPLLPLLDPLLLITAAGTGAPALGGRT